MSDQPGFFFSTLCRGVSAISCPADGSCLYAAGADGMISRIDSSTGNLLGKFRASTKAISSMSVSSGFYPCLLSCCCFILCKR